MLWYIILCLVIYLRLCQNVEENKNTRKKVAHNMAKFVTDTLTLSILVSSVIYYFPDLQSHSNMEPNEYIL